MHACNSWVQNSLCSFPSPSVLHVGGMELAAGVSGAHPDPRHDRPPGGAGEYSRRSLLLTHSIPSYSLRAAAKGSAVSRASLDRHLAPPSPLGLSPMVQVQEWQLVVLDVTAFLNADVAMPLPRSPGSCIAYRPNLRRAQDGRKKTWISAL